MVPPPPASHPLAQFKSKSYELAEPYGVVLVMSPWNYPYLLSLDPLFGAVAAGNCVVLKPSAYAPNTSRAMAELIAAVFNPDWVTVIEGGREQNAALLEQRFDYIFFTGSVDVGKMVMEKASRHLTPVTLELGGKSPVIVDRTANIPLTAKRLAFGKLLNAGQTCVAPDYCLVDRKVRDELVEELKSSSSGCWARTLWPTTTLCGSSTASTITVSRAYWRGRRSCTAAATGTTPTRTADGSPPPWWRIPWTGLPSPWGRRFSGPSCPSSPMMVWTRPFTSSTAGKAPGPLSLHPEPAD